eukprot:3050128-Rhodomonas_salina.3
MGGGRRAGRGVGGRISPLATRRNHTRERTLAVRSAEIKLAEQPFVSGQAAQSGMRARVCV